MNRPVITAITLACSFGSTGCSSSSQSGGTTSTGGSTSTIDSTSTDAKSITAGGDQTCVLMNSGKVLCCGLGASGQLGNGTSAASAWPVTVSGIISGDAVAAGGGGLSGSFTCALLHDGTIQCWGSNYYGELGNGSTTNSSRPTTAVGVTNAVQLAAGEDHACTVLIDGTVQCWGYNYDGDLGNGETGGYSSEPVTVSGITNAVSITAGFGHSCALLSDGTVQCWGDNQYGELGNGSTTDSSVPVMVSHISNATAVAAGNISTCALSSGGTVQCWGSNPDGKLGISSTDKCNIEGTDVDCSMTPMEVAGVSNATAIVSRTLRTCALLTSGAIQCWGINPDGALGNGTTSDSSSPVMVSGITNATAVAAGVHHTCALLSDGTVQCWGYNGSDILGNGTITESTVPVTVNGF